MYREHPFRILRYSMKNIWLLIFPFLRGVTVLRFDAVSIYTWIAGAWLDLAVIGAIIVFGFIRWYFSLISVTDDSIVYTQGFIVRIRTRIPFDHVSVGTSESPFYLKPLNAVIVRFDTRAGIFKSADLKLMVRKKVGAELLSHVPTVDEENQIKELRTPRFISIVLFSAFFSSGFSGAVYIAAFFFKGGDIAHEFISLLLSRITETTERISERMLLRIPQAAVGLGSMFLAAWLLSFLVNLARYFYFRVTADDESISLACGLTNRRRYQIRRSHINYTDMRQNLIMKLIGAVTINISCAGYGCDSQKLPVLMPFKNKRSLGRGLERMGIPSVRKLDVRPKKTSWMSYIGLPVIGVFLGFLIDHFYEQLIMQLSQLISAAPEFFEIADKLVEQLYQLTGFLTFMLELPLVWLVFVKTVALMTSGITVRDGNVIVCCSHWTAFHTVIAPKDHVVLVDVYQTIFQKPFGKCNVVIWFCGEAKSSYRVRALTLKQAEKIRSAIAER